MMFSFGVLWLDTNNPIIGVEVHAARGGEQNDIDASVASMYIY